MNTKFELPIKSKNSLSNRSMKRPFKREATEILYNLEAINSNFLIDLFSPNELTYLQIYTFYLSQWNKACHNMAQWGKVVTIDRGWFEEQYRPIEL